MIVSNPIQEPLIQLFHRLNSLYGLLFLLNNQLNAFQEMAIEIDKKNNNQSYWFSGTSIVISDLTEYPDNRLRRYYRSGGCMFQGKQYLDMIESLIARESAWSIAQGYEAFEAFLFDTAAEYLRLNPTEAEIQQVNRFDIKCSKSILSSANIEDWKEFIRYTYRGEGNRKILKYLRKLAPQLAKVEKQNNRPIDLCEWYTIVGDVRHAATHSNFTIKSQRMCSWTNEHKTNLYNFFPGDTHDNGYTLKLKEKDVEKGLTTFVEYAFIIFKCLSCIQGYEWQIFKED